MVGIHCASVPECQASELAIVLEVWEHGATVQTSFPVAAGSPVGLAVEQKELAAEVTRCEADQGFGYILDLEIPATDEWFPRGYEPAWQSPGKFTSANAPFVC